MREKQVWGPPAGQIWKDWVSNCCNQNLHARCSADTTCPCRAACRSLKVSPFQSHAADLPLYCPTVLRWRQIKACCPFPRMNLCAQSIFALFQTWHQVLSTWIKFRVYLQGFSDSCSFFLRNMDPTFLLEILGMFAWTWSLKGSNKTPHLPSQCWKSFWRTSRSQDRCCLKEHGN